MKHIRIGDIFIVILALLFVVFMYAGYAGKNKEKNKIVIEANGKLYRYKVDKDIVIEIMGKRGKAVIEITNKIVRFKDSSCPDKICVRDGVLKNIPLICLPNNIVIMYEEKKKKTTEADSIGY